MERIILLTLILSFGTFQIGNAQNLIPDGTFSIHNNIGCPPPYQTLLGSPYWYAVGNTTVDFFLADCDYADPAGSISSFWNYPYSSNGFIGFWGVFRSDFTMGSEIFGTVLNEPLKTNRVYYFSTDVRYRGKTHPYDEIFPLYCPSDPPLTLQIYADTDTISSSIDIDGAARQVFSNKVLTLDSPAITDTILTNEWINIWGCFTANGGETDLGFSLTVDSFEPVEPCIGSFADPWISISYYNLDNIELIPFPNEISDTLSFCKEEGKAEFDAVDYFETIDIQKFQPVWNDGIEGTKRSFTEGGHYSLTLNYECGTTRFDIYIQEKKCEPTTFVPNAFTPNFDGRNDELRPFFSVDFPISNYEFIVFDRWGNVCYRSENYDGFTGWDGAINGKMASNGVYVWALKFDLTTPAGTKSYQESGDVLLVR